MATSADHRAGAADVGGTGDVPVSAFGKLVIPTAEANRRTDGEIISRLVESGVSRLSAARIVEVQRGGAEASRARRHTKGRFDGS